MRKTSLIPLIALAGLMLLGCSTPEPAPDLNEGMESKILKRADVSPDNQDWGVFRPYFTQNSISTSTNLVGVTDIKAGRQIHPPHRHADEEYLMVTSGSGTWYLNGETFPASEGDILYAKPWDYHGITAAPESDLQFVVFKWSGKSVNVPDLDPSLPEELEE